jgi:hypothetical protein
MRFDAFIGPAYTVQSLNVDAERCVNLYLEPLESDGGKTRAALYGVPGLTPFVSGLAGPIRGCFAQDGRAFLAAGARFYEVFTTGTATDRGAILDDFRPVSIHSNGLGGNQLFIVAGRSGYIYSLTANTLTLIADVDFPTGSATMGEFFDQYFFVLVANSLSFQISSLSNGTTWAAADRGTRSRASDNMVAIIRSGLYLWLLGSRTSEPWYDSGAANFPFAPVPSALLEMGCAAAFSACRADNALFFLGQDQRGARLVLRIDQGSLGAARVSTFAVEYALNGYAAVSNAVGYSYQEAGHTFYILTSDEWPTSWAYDTATGLWAERQKWNSATGASEAQRGIAHCYAFDKHLVGSRETGILYEQRLGLYAEGEAPIRWLRRAPHLCDEQNRTYHSRFQLDLETGVGLTSGQGSAPTVMFRWSDNGGHTWSNTQYPSIGAMGQWGTRTYSWRLGMARDRVYEVSGSDPVKTALIGAYLEGIGGTA